MRKFLLAVSASALLSLGAGAASAGVVTFDDAAGNAILNQQGHLNFSDQGLSFSGDAAMAVWSGSSPNSNGTNNNIFGFGQSDLETITKTGGGLFNLYSIDLAISWYDGNATEEILVNGSPLTITQTLTTYNLNLLNVSSVTISGVASGAGYWTADNITTNVSAGVPEPALWVAMVAGLGGAGAMLRRRRMVSAAI